MANADLAKHKPIFVIADDTEVRQLWFVGSSQRDIMAMLYEDPEEGWILRVRWRHYAEEMPADDPEWAERTAFDGRDQKTVYTIRPKAETVVDEENLTSMAEGFTKIAEEVKRMFQSYDPDAFVWTQEVSSGKEVIEILQRAPWAFSQRVEREH